MISDVHEQWHGLTIPECDLLISAGDYSYKGFPDVVFEFHTWLSKQPAKFIISCQGNHELWVEKNFREALDIVKAIDPRIIFIAEGSVNLKGLKIWCSAVTPHFHNWAWNVPRGEDIKKNWDRIPSDTVILITHGPAYGILDQIDPYGPKMVGTLEGTGAHIGCEDLRNKTSELEKLKLHVFGHIHGSSGEYDENFVHYVNASICNEKYRPVNPVRVWDLEEK